MGAWQKITRSNFFIKLKNWEYWPFGIVQFPIIMYWLWLALRSRSLVFFSASNPGIVMGGMFGESKYDVLKKIPRQYIPKTILIQLPATAGDVKAQVKGQGFSFPVIFKPDLGERGFMVRRIRTQADIEQYINQVKVNFLVQELVDLPLEFGVFYTRFPSHGKGAVTSIVMKEMLSVTGDGTATLQELILNKDRAKLQWEKLKVVYRDRLHEVLPLGSKLELVSIGNHALGTKFLNGNHLINEKLSDTFDQISKQIPGFYFGRYDLRCASLSDLYEGKVRIVELNGCGAEPAHIYDPSFKLLHALVVLFRHALVVLFRHWSNIFEIARENHKLGVKYISHKEARELYKQFKAATR
jgi:hypothetical protein